MAKGDKYIGLGNYLLRSDAERVVLSFNEIEKIIGDKLPQSAFKYEAWWSNNYDHSQAITWMDAGYRTDFVSDTLKMENVIFIKN